MLVLSINKRIKNVITIVEQNPKKLFLIDGFGAILSAFLLGIVLVKLEVLFGIPPSTLYILAAIPLLYVAYDFYSYIKTSQKAGLLLKGIAVLNLIYCCISLGLAFYHSTTITNLGWVYIVIEILVILLLAILEFSVGRKITKSNTQYGI